MQVFQSKATVTVVKSGIGPSRQAAVQTLSQKVFLDNGLDRGVVCCGLESEGEE